MKTPEDLAKETLLKKFKFNPNTWTDFHTAFIYGYDAAKPEWVSVEERLPEESLVLIAYCCGVTIAFFDGDWRHPVNPLTPLLSVTHWMLLPKPPEDK